MPPSFSKIWLIICFSTCLVKSATAQLGANFFEKVYLHTDRSWYVAGDTLWLTAYLVNGTYHTPSAFSQTLYVHLLDATGKTITNKILRVDSAGHAPANFLLPDSLRAGTYQLLAFTNFMRNAEKEFLFRKTIRIDSHKEHVAETKTPPSAGIRLRLFPEGGQLVVGLPGRVAFQALDSLGHSLSVTGILVSQQGDTLTDFRSLHRGMGAFSFTPQVGKHYRAIATSGNGQITSVDLPDALPTGYQLAVSSLTNPHNIRVIVHNSHPELGQLSLFAHMHSQVYYQAQLDSNKAQLILAIPTDSIPQDGILHLILFDPDNRPVAERLVFVNQQRQLTIRIQSDQPAYKPRQRVSLTVTTTDPAGNPVPACLSLAITDRKQAPDAEPGAATLRSYLLLTSDLRGHIEEPEFYFDSTQAHARQYLDYVMLTHGWRRFHWLAMPSDSANGPHYEVETGIRIAGQVRYSDDNKLARQADLSGMLKTNRNLLLMDITTDREGGFSIENLLFSDTATIIIRHRTNRPVKLALAPQPIPGFVALPTVFASPSVDRQVQINKALQMQAFTKALQENGGRMLQEATVKGQRPGVGTKDLRRSLYGGSPDVSVKITNAMASGKTSAVDLFAFLPVGKRIAKPKLMLDGVPISAAGIETMSAFDVEAIDVALGGFTADSDGVINILTKRGPEAAKPINQAMGKIVGYAIRREFYAPQYATETATTTPDYRATLYWNPTLQTDATGKATVTFYNSDETTSVRIMAEGLSRDGKPGYQQLLYQVKK